MIGSIQTWNAEPGTGVLKAGVSCDFDQRGHYFRLVRNSTGFVSGGTVRTSFVRVASLKRWLGFDVVVVNERDVLDPVAFATSMSYRIAVGDDELWWDGSSWVVAIDEWNTQLEVFDALPELEADTIAVIARLETEDPRLTPRLRELRVAFELADDYELVDDLIRNALLPELREVRGAGRVRIESDGANPIVWSEITERFESPYDLPIPTGAWDHTVDPKHRRNKFASYANDELLLTEDPIDTHQIEVSFSYRPLVAYTTSADYLMPGVRDIGRVPAVTIEGVERTSRSRATHLRDFVVRRAGDAITYVVPGYRVVDIEITIHVITDKRYDLIRLGEAVTRRLNANPKITIPGCGHECELRTGDLNDIGSPNLSEIHEASVSLRVMNVALFDHEIKVIHAVKTLNVETLDQASNHTPLKFKVE